MEIQISYNEREYKENYIVKALENGEWIQFRPKGYETWVNFYPSCVAVLPNSQLNFIEYDFRIMTKEFAEFLRKMY